MRNSKNTFLRKWVIILPQDAVAAGRKAAAAVAGMDPVKQSATVSHTIFAFNFFWYVTPVLVKTIGNDIFTFECCLIEYYLT